MKKLTLILLALSIGIMSTGCSKTWQGVKQDSYNLWNGTKQVIHESTN